MSPRSFYQAVLQSNVIYACLRFQGVTVSMGGVSFRAGGGRAGWWLPLKSKMAAIIFAMKLLSTRWPKLRLLCSAG